MITSATLVPPETSSSSRLNIPSKGPSDVVLVKGTAHTKGLLTPPKSVDIKFTIVSAATSAVIGNNEATDESEYYSGKIGPSIQEGGVGTTINKEKLQGIGSRKASLPAITMAQFKERVNQGNEVLVIIHDKVYNLTKWINHHPGGALPILSMKGKDATDAVIAFHSARVISERMGAFCIGVLKDAPPILPISKAYRLLEVKLVRDGFYQTNYWFYVREGARFLGLWAAMLFCSCILGPRVHSLFYVAGAILGACLWHQAAFYGHDAGHNGIAHDQRTDFMVGALTANFLGGVSLGWWKQNHNVHHLVTNDPEHDPDIQHLPFFAITTKFFNSLYSTYHKRIMSFDAWAKRFVSIQHHLYYVVLAFGRFNLYAESWKYLLSPGVAGGKVPYRNFEITGLVFFWIWYSALLYCLPSWSWRFFYILLSHLATVFLHLQITLSHFAMPTDTPEVELAGGQEDFITKALRTSMDVDCPRWMDWFHGGLQFQVGHHLFPRLPRHNLRSLQPLVRQLAADHGLEFHSYGFRNCNRRVLGVLKGVADQVGVVLSVDPTKLHAH